MHICVCVCTYKRPILLDNLLEKLISQTTDNLFSYSIIVVDNDCKKSAESIVYQRKENSNIGIEYFIEEEPNVSLARNKAIKNANGDLLAFVDDDEYPSWDWLFNLFCAYKKFNCSGIIGRVERIFPVFAPLWIKKISLFKLEHKTGIILERDMYTGNALLDMKLFEEKDNYFLPEFGGGGGDAEFFYRNRKRGHKFIWCNEAVVYEKVDSERLEISWLLKRHMRYGVVDFRISVKKQPFFLRILVILKNFCLSLVLFFFSPFFLFMGRYKFYNIFFLSFYHIGIFLANFGYFINEYNAGLVNFRKNI